MKAPNSIKGILAGALLLALFTIPALAGVNMLYYVNYGLYPYAATNTTTTVPGTGLLANNGSGSALLQLIYAGSDMMIGDGTNIFDLSNGANGLVAGDDVVWQSTTIEAGVSGTDEWGFSSMMFPYGDSDWSTAGFIYLRVFQDESPQLGEAFYDSPLLALDTASTMGGIFGQTFSIDGSTAGIALNQRLVQTTNITRTIGIGEWDLMSVPVWVDPTNTFGVVGDTASVGSMVYFYETSISNFYGGSKSAKGWGAAQANRVVLPGESFFLHSDTYSTGSVITITGTIPTTPITNQVHERWSALGYPFPASVIWTDTSLSSNLPAGSLAYFWNMDNQEYEILLKGPPAKGGWGAEGVSTVIQPGDGFIVRQPLGSSAFEWVVQP